jgi:hypothetical protein
LHIGSQPGPGQENAGHWLELEANLEVNQEATGTQQGTPQDVNLEAIGSQPASRWKPTCLPLATNLPAQHGSRLEANHGKTNLQANLRTYGNHCGNHWTRNHRQATGKRSWEPLEASLAKQSLEKRLETKLDTTGGQPGNR